MSAAGVTYAPDKVGQAFSFDGVGDVTNPTNANLSTANFTIDAWVNPSLIDSDYTRIITRLGSYGIYVRNNSQIWFRIDGLLGFPNDGQGDFCNGLGLIPTNQWTHIALSYDGSRVKTYVNEVLTRTVTY